MGVTIAPGLRFRIACRMALNNDVSMRLMPTSGATVIDSTVTLGSLMRAFMSEINSSALVPGSSRQSSVASLVDGMTLGRGGEPTPAVNEVSDTVLRWMAELNLF